MAQSVVSGLPLTVCETKTKCPYQNFSSGGFLSTFIHSATNNVLVLSFNFMQVHAKWIHNAEQHLIDLSAMLLLSYNYSV